MDKELKSLKKIIAETEKKCKAAEGKDAFILKKQVIELSQQQYIIKSKYSKQIYCGNGKKGVVGLKTANLIGETAVKNNEIIDRSVVSLFNPEHIHFLLLNYEDIKSSDLYADSDLGYLIEELDELIAETPFDNELYLPILNMRISGIKNRQISDKLLEEYGNTYTPEYISSLWNKKLPKMIAETAQKKYILWYFTYKEKGNWQKCSCCKEVKLAHPLFYSRNSCAKSGFYSICKDCRKKYKI